MNIIRLSISDSSCVNGIQIRLRMGLGMNIRNHTDGQ